MKWVVKLMIVVFLGEVLFTSCKPFKNTTSIRIVCDTMAELRPGGNVRFGIKTLDRRGRRKATKGFAGGKIKMEKFDVRLSGGWQSTDTFHIDTFVEPGVYKTVKLAVYVPSFPKLADSIELPLSYAGEATWNFSGAKGVGGKDGKVRILPVRVDGTAVSDGKPGKDGGNGGNGHDVEVYIRRVFDTAYSAKFGTNVIAVKVYDQQTRATKFTYISEVAGKLIILTDGGVGGEGGDGGPGSDGRDGDDVKLPGNGANGGIGGKGGNGGRGGNITIYISAEDKDLLNRFVFSNKGAAGGAGGHGGTAGRGGVGANRKKGLDGTNGPNGGTGVSGNAGTQPKIILGPVSLF
jgi:hypothetical protein